MKKYLLSFAIFLCTISAWSLRITDLDQLAGREEAVTEIDFSNKGLTEFPGQILKCKNLRSLNLSNNGIVHIPVQLANLEFLTELNLSHNMGLFHTDLEAVLSSARFKLEVLNLESCDLLAMPENIGTQKNLRSLDFSNNRAGAIPYSAMELTKLQHADLSGNDLTGVEWVVNFWWSLKSLDVSQNKSCKGSDLLVQLSFFDQLNAVSISDVDRFPEEFDMISLRSLTVKNSTINKFPRSNRSAPIKRLEFDACTFEHPEEVTHKLNTYSQPELIVFRNMPADQLAAFLELKVDSVILDRVGNVSLNGLVKNSKLKYIDLRKNPIDEKYINEFKAVRPDVQIVSREPVKPMLGVNPPIEKFVAVPQELNFMAGKTDLELNLGKMNLTVPAGSIVDQAGNPYQGEVILTYNTYTNPVEIFYSGISMTSTENDETMMFSSGGMFTLNAEDNRGNPLFVNEATPLSVEMLSPNATPDMSLWYLDENGVWQMKGEDTVLEPFKYDQQKLDSVANLDYLEQARSQTEIYTDRFVPHVKWLKELKTFSLSFEFLPTIRKNRSVQVKNERLIAYNVDYAGRFFTKRSIIYEGDSAQFYYEMMDSISEYCEKKYERLRVPGTNQYNQYGPNYLVNMELLPDYKNDRFSLSFRYKDSVLVLPVNLFPMDASASTKIAESKRYYKNFVREWRKAWRAREANFRKIKTEQLKLAKLLQESAIEREKQRQEMMRGNEEYMRDYAGEGSLIRAFQINGFGTWNCDVRRRMKMPVPMTDKLVILASDSLNHARIEGDDRIFIIDHTMNSAIEFPSAAEAFFDKVSKSTIVVFLTSSLVAIHHTWKDRMTSNSTEVRLLNIEKMSKETFTKFLMDVE